MKLPPSIGRSGARFARGDPSSFPDCRRATIGRHVRLAHDTVLSPDQFSGNEWPIKGVVMVFLRYLRANARLAAVDCPPQGGDFALADQAENMA